MKPRKKLSAIIALLLILGIAMVSVNSCSKSGSSNTQPPPGGNPTSFDISGMAFPGTITVKKGTIVTWNNKDGYAHTVTSDDGTSFNSGNLAAGASYSFTTTTVGTFTYHCNIHSNMHGSLIVTP